MSTLQFGSGFIQVKLFWPEFKAMCSSKVMGMQAVELEERYELFATDSIIVYSCVIFRGTVPPGWSETQETNDTNKADYEGTYKSGVNKPLEVKAGPGRPHRIAPSPQPANTTEMWKGYRLELGVEEYVGVIDMSFDVTIYLKGGCIYSDDASPGDTVSAAVVLKANPAVVLKAGILDSIHMSAKHRIDFLSSECMEFTNAVMLRVTYTKKAGDSTTRDVSAIADYFKPNA